MSEPPGSPIEIRPESCGGTSLRSSDSVTGHLRHLAVALEREHAIERDARATLHGLGHADRVHDVPFGEVFERPQQVRGIDAVHGRARAYVLLQRMDVLVRV